MIIRSEIHTDDFVHAYRFNAALWFEEAEDDEIVALASIEWGGDYESDEVGRFFDGKISDITRLFEYLGSKTKVGRAPFGFEVNINEADALRWVSENRPHLLDKIYIETGFSVADMNFTIINVHECSWDDDNSWSGEYQKYRAPGLLLDPVARG